MKVAAISLKRTPERWNTFLKRNQVALNNCELIRVDGIDGSEWRKSDIQTRLIAKSAHQQWTAGAIGIAMSHRLCWRLCCNSGSPLVVLEDDVILAEDWEAVLEGLLHHSAGIVLMGWNLDSVLRAEFSRGQEFISLFEPAYPSEEALNLIVNSDEARQTKRLRSAFGLPGYWLHPTMAEQLLKKIPILEAIPLVLGRGFPKITTNGIDAMLNLHYHQLKAEVVIPPLALALNNPVTSLTRPRPHEFGERKC